MKFGLKSLASAAVLLAVGSAANATIIPGPAGGGSQGSELFVNLYNPTSSVSWTYDTGLRMDSLLSGNFSATIDLTGQGMLSGSGLVWNALAAQGDTDQLSTWGFVTTSLASAADLLASANQDLIAGAANKINEFISALNSAMAAQGYPNSAGTGHATLQPSDSGNYANQSASTIGNTFAAGSEVALGQSSALYYFGYDENTGEFFYKQIGTATLSNNSLVLQGVNAVPLPAAVWLFGSGLLGLAGVARRRTV